MKKSTKIIYISAAIAVLTSIGVFAYARKRQQGAAIVDLNGNAIAVLSSLEVQPNVIQDTLTSFWNSLIAPAPGTISQSNYSKVLQYGLTNDSDVKLLQNYLNNVTKIRKQNAMRYLAVLSLNGDFSGPMAAMMQLYLGKTDMTVMELNERISAYNLTQGVNGR